MGPDAGSGELRGSELDGLTAAFRAARAALGNAEVAAAGSGRFTGQELTALAQEAELLMRRAEATQRAITAAADASGVFRHDGHRNASAWLRAATRCSRAEALGRTRGAALLERMPRLAAAVADDCVPSAHLRTVAAAFANPRVADNLVAADEWVTKHAVREDHDTFRRVIESWERLADFDGSHREAAEAHAGRMAGLSVVGDEVHLRARCGIAQGAILREVFGHFVDAELQLDVEQARAAISDRSVAEDDLARTQSQRRFDALHAIFEAAASAPVDGRTPEVMVNVVVDQGTYEASIATLYSGHLDTSAVDPQRGRCELIDGSPLDWVDVATASLLGRVRRVVFDSAGVVIDLGRSSRLFTGSAREAARLQGVRCRWPGCGQSHHTQVDHMVPWPDGGPTSPANADPLCGYHNRWKHANRFRPRRDVDGVWHLHRPDGSELFAA